MKKLESFKKVNQITDNQKNMIVGGRTKTKKTNDTYRFYSTCEQTPDQIVEIQQDNGQVNVYVEDCDE